MIIGIDASRAFAKEKTGTENYAACLIQKLIEIDKKNHYWLYLRPEVQPSFLPKIFLEKTNVRLITIPWPRLWTQGGLALECFLRPPDILFIPSHTMPVIRRSNLKVVVTIHGLEYQYLPEYYQFPQKLYLNKSTEYAVAHAHHLIAVSQWTKKQLIKNLKADSKKITVVYEGVRLTNDKEHVVNKKPLPYILFVGTVQPRKNLIRLIQAFSLIQDSCPPLRRARQAHLTARQGKVQLLIAGKSGWMNKEIYEAPGRFGVEKKVKFLGYVSDQKLALLYQQALFFILPSLCEGFGLPVLEAMKYGCPVIAARAGALPEIVGEAGLLVDPLNVEEIAGAMKLMLENNDLREALREKGYSRVRHFSWQKTAQETIEVFQKVYEG